MIVNEPVPFMTRVMQGCVLVGILLLTASFWGWAHLPTTLAAYLWGVVVVAILFIVALYLIGKCWPSAKPAREPTTAPAHTQAPATHAAGGHDAHGHEDHGSKKRTDALWTAFWILFWVVLGLGVWTYMNRENNKEWFDLSGLLHGSAPAAGSPAPASPVSTSWVPFTAPTDGWHDIDVPVGYNLIVCSPTTDSTCAATKPEGFRMRCVRLDGTTEEDWGLPGSCPSFVRLRLQSTSGADLAMVSRLQPR